MTSEAKHVPWEVVSLSGSGGPFAIRMAAPKGWKNSTFYGVQGIPLKETAERIVACVNACAGISTKQLEAGCFETGAAAGECNEEL